MIEKARACLARCSPALAQDAVGVAALVVMLMVALHLPVLF